MQDSCFSFAKALRRAIDGLLYALKTQANLRIQLSIAFLVLITSLILKLSSLDFFLVFFTVILVLSAEMINTAFEAFTNLLEAQWHQQAKIAKDVAAGMVLVVSAGAVLVGLMIFIPYLKAIF